MGNKQIKWETPIAMLTVGQLQEMLQFPTPETEPVHRVQSDDKQYVFGLRGISELFGVSHPTAQRYKDTFLKPAISQNGRKIIVDKDLALQLFNQRNN